MKQVYKITYPTDKIYIGKDSIGSHRYSGSPHMDVANEAPEVCFAGATMWTALYGREPVGLLQIMKPCDWARAARILPV